MTDSNGWKKVEEPVDGMVPDQHNLQQVSPATAEASPETPEDAPDETDEMGETVKSRGTHVRARGNRKRALPQTTSAEELALTDVPEQDALQSAEQTQEADHQEPPTIHASARYNSGGRRRGRHRFAAPLGLLVILLAVTGVVSLCVWGIQAILKAQDDTALRKELYKFLTPVMMYDPPAFKNVSEATQNESLSDTLILAAIEPITRRESIRQQQEKDDSFSYPVDDNGCLIIPAGEVEESYRTLFGTTAKINHHSVGSEEAGIYNYQYDEEAAAYHVPVVADTTINASMYTTVFDKVKKKGDTVTIRVGYALTSDLAIDDEGQIVQPSPDDAVKFQLYTVKKTKSGWNLISIADETAKK